MSRAARRDLVKRALQAYKDMFGNLLVHQKFVIPEGSDLWGLKLGSIVNTVRNNNYYKELRPELEEMGFDYDPQPIGYGWDLVKRALQAYERIYEDLLVPASFTIPEGDASWERDLWGMKLGITVMSIRNRDA
jgi:hypothetical protein